jgi:hypothetical protein
MKSTGVSSRRDFLLAAGLGAAASMAAVGTQWRKPGATNEVAHEHSHGYRTSPHVMKYYQTTKV